MASPNSELIEFLGKNGHKAQVVSVSRLTETESALTQLKQSGAITADFYPEITKYFNFDYKVALPEAESIIIVASPQPPTRVLFNEQSVIIPPTYIYKDIWVEQLRLLKEFLEPSGCHLARARLPFKTLAVRSGLGKYGRNNICYIPGMGSYFRLGAFYSDMPCEDDSWGTAAIMKVCQACELCADKCPTGCISINRFTIQADRCLTHFNENVNPVPDWIKPDWHNALLGCMVCQEVCPVNLEFTQKMHNATERFSKIETDVILSETPQENLGSETLSKLEALCLADSDVYPILKRNLSWLIDR
jgi:epoxyqueuosine reductase